MINQELKFNASISVIIPVFNAAPFIIDAVNSALNQPETGEVLLIEDGSPDGSLAVCCMLARKHPKVKLFRHPGGENMGASVSRNLGINNSNCEFVAFLDADDKYLPARFSKTMKVLKENPEIDGVYEAIGTFYEDQDLKVLFSETLQDEVITINVKIPPTDLFKSLMLGKAGGEFSLDGLTVRRKIFEKKNIFFDVDFRLSQDTLFIYQLSAKAELMGGEIVVPVALRRIHRKNRITYHQADQRGSYYSRKILYDRLLHWAKSDLEYDQVVLVIIKIILHYKSIRDLPDYTLRDILDSSVKILLLVALNPRIFVSKQFWNWALLSNTVKRLISKKDNHEK